MEEAEKLLICRRYFRSLWTKPTKITKSSSFHDIFDKCQVRKYTLSDFLRTLLEMLYQISIKMEPFQKDRKRYDKYGNEIKAKGGGSEEDDDDDG